MAKKSRVISLKNAAQHITNFFNMMSDDQITVYAAQATFFIIISSIPFILLLLSLAKYIINVDWFMDFISMHVKGDIGELLKHILEEIVGTGGISLVSVTVLTTLWSASRGVNAVTRGIAGAYGIKLRENFIFDILRSFLYTISFIVIIIASMTALIFADTIRMASAEKLPLMSLIFEIISDSSRIVFAVLLTLFFALLFNTVAKKGKRLSKSEYHVMSDKLPRGFAAQLPGAAAAALGWILFSYFYRLYIEYYPNSSYVYGSLAAIVFMFLWLYFCMIILMSGAEINKIVFRISQNRREKRIKSPKS